MQLFETINRARQMHCYIQREATGSPDKFAEQLHVSRRMLYYLLEELKDFGAEIGYNRNKETFYYKNHFEFDLTIKVNPLTEHEKKYTFGGSIEKKQMYARTLHRAGISLSM